jgi:hypothetical protein
MSSIPSCVHCLGPLREPGLWSSAWQCETHGDSIPFFAAAVPSPHVLDRLRIISQVPLWVPEPLPPGWCVSAIGSAGDGDRLLRSGAAGWGRRSGIRG